MFTIIISAFSGALVGLLVFLLSKSFVLSIFLGMIIVLAINFFLGKYFLKKLTELFKLVEKDIKSDKPEKAIERLKDGYKYSKWQFFVKEQINSQIGIILYSKKRFEEALPYLQSGFQKNWLSMAMLATYYYKEKQYDNMKNIMEKAIKNSPKEGFLYTLYAYYLQSINETDKALEVLTQGNKKVPLDEKLEASLEAIKNNKKIKIQNYGNLWLQLNIEKIPQGAKPYHMHLMNQKIRRR
jgi:tetratricopeptide (TPR) repeat protein